MSGKVTNSISELAAPESVNVNAPAANSAGAVQPVELIAAPEAEAFEGDEAARAEDFTEEAEAVEQPRDSFDEIDFGREFQDYLDPGYKTQEFEYKEDAPTFEQFLTRPESLSEHLNWSYTCRTLTSAFS